MAHSVAKRKPLRRGRAAERRRVRALTLAAPTPADSRLQSLRRIAIVPALNEADTIASVIDEIRGFDPGLEIVVVDDGSTDDTRSRAIEAGARVIRLAVNLGIGGAMQAGYLYAREQGFELAFQVDGDGQHDARALSKLAEPILEGRADVVVGTRFAGDRDYRASVARRIGMQIFASIVSLLVRQRVTDTTSGFRAVNRRGICLFAADYPHDYPEVEAIVLAVRNRLELAEVPVAMRERSNGRSSITAWRSVYYMVKVTLALFVGLFRRHPTPPEAQ